ncbi:urease subunit beta [Saccharicrinis carchari]|uniref:Urease subunit beta n=1 Tax=Saccharicrinis carchari TaxID=1168039 RepID=A0A521AEL5_SACCC|nr:urease subunit beta [Saccharicrinis carchari]SMO33265.1 urease subunit beta [Saccharicrinis carchari]
MIPGEYILKEEDIICNADSDPIRLTVTNAGDRPIQVGSHYHFYEVNNALEFDREKTYGKRLDLPAGSSVRFEPGDKKEIALIDYKGRREVYGFQNKVDGPLKSL